MTTALVYGYSCCANDIIIPRYTQYRGRQMSPQEYAEYSKWYDYCCFCSDIDWDSTMIIGECIVWDGNGASIEDMQDATKNISAIEQAVYDLTGRDIEAKDCQFYAIEVDWW